MLTPIKVKHMSIFSYLGEYSDITDITFNDRKRLGPLDKASQRIMRSKSSFSFAEKEMMAAYVSGLNSCQFCFGSHLEVAKQFGVNQGRIKDLLDDVDTAYVAEQIKPVFKYLYKLTKQPSTIVDSDAQAVYKAGWSEQDLHEAILVGCLFNFYNRLLDGHGVKGSSAIYKLGGEVLYKRGYGVPWFIGLIKKSIRRSKLKKIKNLSSAA